MGTLIVLQTSEDDDDNRLKVINERVEKLMSMRDQIAIAIDHQVQIQSKKGSDTQTLLLSDRSHRTSRGSSRGMTPSALRDVTPYKDDLDSIEDHGGLNGLKPSGL